MTFVYDDYFFSLESEKSQHRPFERISPSMNRDRRGHVYGLDKNEVIRHIKS